MIRAPGRIVLGLVLGGWFLAAGAAAQEDERTGELLHGAWRGSALGRGADGGFLLLADPDGFLRVEVGLDPGTDLDDLLARRGRGWTVIAGRGGEGTRNAWDREWTALEPRLARLLWTGADLLASAPAEPWRTRRVVHAGEGTPPLRRRLAARGRGRGGPGEILEARGDGTGRVELASSRRPGSLRLGPILRRSVTYPVREAFVPLWPLAELVATDVEFPGTPDPRER